MGKATIINKVLKDDGKLYVGSILLSHSAIYTIP